MGLPDGVLFGEYWYRLVFDPDRSLVVERDGRQHRGGDLAVHHISTQQISARPSYKMSGVQTNRQ